MFIVNINGLYFLKQGVSFQYLFIKFKRDGPFTYGFINILQFALSHIHQPK